MKTNLRQILGSVWLSSALRLALGGLFITSSIAKLQAPADFTEAVLSYGILPHSLAEFYASALSWAELFIGASLVLGIFSTFASAISIPLILSFVIANAYGLLDPAAGDYCGECLGSLISLGLPVALTIDVAMLLAAGLLLLYRDSAGSLGVEAWLSRHGPGLRKKWMFLAQLAMLALPMVLGASLVNPSDADMYDTPELLFFYDGDRAEFETEFTILADWAVEYGQKIVFFAINYGDDPEAAQEFDVGISPTVLLITGKIKHDGYIEYARFEGTVDGEELRTTFDQLLQD